MSERQARIKEMLDRQGQNVERPQGKRQDVLKRAGAEAAYITGASTELVTSRAMSAHVAANGPPKQSSVVSFRANDFEHFGVKDQRKMDRALDRARGRAETQLTGLPIGYQ